MKTQEKDYWDKTALWWVAADRIAEGKPVTKAQLRSLKSIHRRTRDTTVRQMCIAVIRITLDRKETLAENDDFTHWVASRAPSRKKI